MAEQREVSKLKNDVKDRDSQIDQASLALTTVGRETLLGPLLLLSLSLSLSLSRARAPCICKRHAAESFVDAAGRAATGKLHGREP